jgi:hypothetical protein
MEISGKQVDHTFEALVQASGPLEELVEVRPAVEHSLEGIVICKLHKRAVKHIGEFHSLFHLVPAKNATVLREGQVKLFAELKRGCQSPRTKDLLTLRVPLQWWHLKQALW